MMGAVVTDAEERLARRRHDAGESIEMRYLFWKCLLAY
jgi:hypothetical protein